MTTNSENLDPTPDPGSPEIQPPPIDQEEVRMRLDIARHECLTEFVQDCREIMVLIGKQISHDTLTPKVVAVPPSIILLPVPRINMDNGELEIAAHSFDTRSPNDTSRGNILQALGSIGDFPYHLHFSRSIQGSHLSFEQAVNLLEVLTAYMEHITGVTNDLSRDRNPKYKAVLPLLETAEITSPIPGFPDHHRIEGRDIVINELELNAFRESLLVFVEQRIIHAVTKSGVYSPQSLLPAGVNLGEATHGLILAALKSSVSAVDGK